MFKFYQCFDESLIIYLDTCLDVSIASSLLIYLDMKTEEQIRWFNKHLAVMLLMLYLIFYKSRCFVLPT
jgi:hypothetical protein